MNILRFSRKQKIFSTIALSSLCIFLVVSQYQFLLSQANNLWDNLWPINILLMLVMSMAVLFVVYRIVLILSYHIKFNDTFFEVQMARIPFRQSFKCAYADVSIVRKAAPSVIEIVPNTGKPLRFVPTAFEGGEEKVFQLLSQYIPAERFEPDLRQNYKRFSRFEKVFYTFAILMMTVHLLLMLFWSPGLIPLPLSWNYFGPWSWQSDSISGFSVESPDSVWVTSHRYYPAQFTVKHISANKTETWSVPNNLFHEFDQLENSILVGTRQQPVLIADKAIYFTKDGQQWERIDYQAGYRLTDLNNTSTLTAESWLRLYNFDAKENKTLFVHIQADSLQPQVVTFVDPVTQKNITPFLIKTASNGTVLLEDDNLIYTLRDGKLQEQRYNAAPDKNKLLYINDFTLADDGNLYVLAEDSVERITPEGKQTFTQLPAIPQSDGWTGYYDSLVVDGHGRLWVSWSLYSVGVFEPNWNGTARRIVIYDRYNSNYQNTIRDSLFRTTDGRIWAAKNQLVWIDGDAAELPAPLPDWLAQIRRPGPITLIFGFAGLIPLIGISLRNVFRRKQNLPM